MPSSRFFLFSFTVFLLFSLFCSGSAFAGNKVDGRVSWVYDGDTIKVEGIGKVRFIGVDAPEKENGKRDRYLMRRGVSRKQLRKTAKDGLHFLIRKIKGKQVHLKFDRERKDRYGRTLAYVYLKDGTFINRLLIKKGLAVTYRRFDFREKGRFIKEEKKARKRGVGLWSGR